MTARARFKQADLTRALKGVVAAGMQPGRIEIDERGRIIILTGREAAGVEPNPWDEVLGK